MKGRSGLTAMMFYDIQCDEVCKSQNEFKTKLNNFLD